MAVDGTRRAGGPEILLEKNGLTQRVILTPRRSEVMRSASGDDELLLGAGELHVLRNEQGYLEFVGIGQFLILHGADNSSQLAAP